MVRYYFNPVVYCAPEELLSAWLFSLVQHVAAVADWNNYDPDITSVIIGVGMVVFEDTDLINHVENNPNYHRNCTNEVNEEIQKFQSGEGIFYAFCKVMEN